MADFIVDGTGVARSQADENMEGAQEMESLSIKRQYSVMSAASMISSPLFGIAKYQLDRRRDKDIRDKYIAKFVRKIPCLDLSALPSNLLSEGMLDGSKKIKVCSDEMKTFASQLLQSAVSNGLVGRAFSGALQCNIDISKLAQSTDGYLRGFALSNGKIAEQAKFTEIPAIQVSGPLLAFQIASMITGQYYQHIITRQLESISQKLDLVLNLLEKEDQAVIQNGFRQLKDWSSFSNVELDDLIVLRKIQDDAGKLRYKYKDLVLNKKIGGISRSWIRDKNEANDWKEALDNSKFIPYMQVAFMAEYLFYCSNLMLVEHEMSKPNRNESKIKTWSKYVNNDFMQPYAEKYHDIKWTVCGNLMLLRDGSSWGTKDIDEWYKEVLNQFDSFDKSVRDTLSSLNPTCFIEYKGGEPIVDSY